MRPVDAGAEQRDDRAGAGVGRPVGAHGRDPPRWHRRGGPHRCVRHPEDLLGPARHDRGRVGAPLRPELLQIGELLLQVRLGPRLLPARLPGIVAEPPGDRAGDRERPDANRSPARHLPGRNRARQGRFQLRFLDLLLVEQRLVPRRGLRASLSRMKARSASAMSSARVASHWRARESRRPPRRPVARSAGASFSHSRRSTSTSPFQIRKSRSLSSQRRRVGHFRNSCSCATSAIGSKPASGALRISSRHSVPASVSASAHSSGPHSLRRARRRTGSPSRGTCARRSVKRRCSARS